LAFAKSKGITGEDAEALKKLRLRMPRLSSLGDSDKRVSGDDQPLSYGGEAFCADGLQPRPASDLLRLSQVTVEKLDDLNSNRGARDQ
jgi:hypothetical protein